MSRVAAVSLVERNDGRLLVVWNKRYGGWTLPGGMVEDGEPVEHAQARELFEETGVRTLGSRLIYRGPHDEASEPGRATEVAVFEVRAQGFPVESEIGCPVTWFTREEFLKWSPFRESYRRIFKVLA